MKKTALYLSLSLVGLLLPACQNNDLLDEGNDLDNPTEASLVETQLDETLESVDLLVDEAIDNNSSLLRSVSADTNLFLSDCPVITVDTLSIPHRMTIDFGSACTGKDGRIRSGKIIVTATSFKIFPSVRHKTFENFVVDGKQMVGSMTKTIQRDLTNATRTATMQEDLQIINLAKGDTLSRVSTITRLYKRNNLTLRSDDQVLTWGSVILTRPNGVVLSKSIDESSPLLLEASCKHIVSGIASFQNSKGKKWSIDYGDGSCDRKATLTMDGTSKEITIR